MMTLTVNGEPLDTDPGQTILGLVAQLGLTGRAVAVEVNKTLIPKRRHDHTELHAGDSVEIVTLVGGG